jgi:hypothetical protein
MEVSVAAVTVTAAEPEMEPTDALTVALPTTIGNKTPLAFTVRMAGLELVHVAEAVRSCVLPSLKTPVAVRPEVNPNDRLNEAGVMLMDLRTAAVTVRFAEPATPFTVAETVVLPEARAVNCPAVPNVLLTLASRGLATLHCADAVTSCVLPSVKAAVAVKFASCPMAMVADAGVRDTETTCAGVTLMSRVAETLPLVPVMLASPATSALTKPLELTFATLGRDELQFNVEVTFCVLPSLNVAVAVSCWLVPTARLRVDGLIAMLESVAAVT